MRAVAADLKVEMIAGRPAGGPHIGNGLPLGNGIAYIDGNRGAVCIQGGKTAAMVNDKIIAVAPCPAVTRTGTHMNDGAGG